MKCKIYLLVLLPFICNSQIDFTKFKGDKVNINNITQLNKPFIYDYAINSSDGKDSIIYQTSDVNKAESILAYSNRYILVSNEDKKNFLKLKYKFSFKTKGRLASMIKYKEARDSILSEYKVIYIIKEKGTWIESNVENMNSIRYVILNLSLKAFWEFYNTTDNPSHPKINALKPLVKDENGVLNIEKLAEVLRDNKEELKEYLEK